jgi:hypothetical protein
MILQLVVPTYNRPKIALESLKKLIRIRDIFPNDISIACSSNKIENSLKTFCSSNNINYNEFEENLGGRRNLKYLLSNSFAEYCMILSDEDSISLSTELVGDFLSFLKSLPEEVGAISCSIGLEFNKKSYFNYIPAYQEFTYNLKDYFLLNMFLPTYMSGLTIKTSSIKNNNNLDLAYEEKMSNAYAHQSLILRLLQTQKLAVYSKQIILKGDEVFFGGDGFSHVSEHSQKIKSKKNNLNPEVYGPEARFNQFTYIDDVIASLKSNFFIKTHARLRNMYAFLKTMESCHDATGITRDDVKESNSNAYQLIKKSNQSNVLVTLFYFISSLPLVLLVFINKLLNNYFRATRFFYFKKRKLFN